jgi:hypothetical protein
MLLWAARQQQHRLQPLTAHNHPSGDPTPSRADVGMTKALIEACRPLDIAIHDHVVVCKQGHASLKALKRFEADTPQRARRSRGALSFGATAQGMCCSENG